MGFERCHPAVNLIYFASVIYATITFRHPLFLIISFLSAFIYSVKRNGRKALVFNLCLLPMIAAFTIYYSSYHHFGMTVLCQNRIGNAITMESIVYGGIWGISIAGVMMWFSCVFSVFTTDKMIYLFGKASPKLSLFLAILLRMIPRMKQEARKMNRAQQGIGRGCNQGNVWEKLHNSLRIVSMLITWLIEALSGASDSMRSRGSNLRGRKAFSIYRFDNRDRIYVITMFFFITLVMMAIKLKQTTMIYDPYIIWSEAHPIFYIGYAILCLMPLALELWTEYRFRKARENAFK